MTEYDWDEACELETKARKSARTYDCREALEEIV